MEPGDDGEPFPPNWVADVVLRDGHTVRIRPIRPDDADGLVRFHDRQSPESVYFRFFSPRPRLTRREVHHFTHVDHIDRVAFVGELAGDLVAVARYERYSGTDTAEVAFFVDDDHQGRGLGMVLLEFLAAAGRERGLRRFTASTLANNRRMLALFSAAGYEVASQLDAGVVEVAFDLDPTEDVVAAMDQRERRAEAASVRRVLAPATIVAVEAGDGRARAAADQAREHGYRGSLHLVDVRGDADPVARVTAGLAALPEGADVVLVAAGDGLTRALVPVVAGHDAGAIVLLDDLPGSTADLVAAARGAGLRFLGPGVRGLVDTDPAVRLHLLDDVGTSLAAGRVGVLVGPGPLGPALAGELARRGVGVSSLVAGGVRGDLRAPDLLSHWADDERTVGVLAHLGTRDLNERFVRAARSVSRHLPVAVLHTPEAHGDAPVERGDREEVRRLVDAVFRQTGVVAVRSVAELVDVGRLLSAQPVPAGRGVAVVGAGTAAAALGREACAAVGLRVVGDDMTGGDRPGGDPAGGAGDAPDPSTPGDGLGALLDRVARRPAVGSVLVVGLGADDAGAWASAVAAASARHPATTWVAVLPGAEDRPLIVADGAAGPNGGAEDGLGVPVFAFPEPAAVALARLAGWRQWRATAMGHGQDRPDDLDVDGAAAVVHACLARRGDSPAPTRDTVTLPADEQAAVLAAIGVRLAPRREVSTPEDAVGAAAEVGWPVALKAPVRDRSRRSASGGVAVDLADADELAVTWDRMAAVLGDDLLPATVQHFVDQGVDVRVRVRRFRDGGGTVEVGLGGPSTAADTPALAVLPLTLADASALVAQSSVGRAMGDPLDRVPLVALVHRLALLVEDVDGVRRVEANPVICSGAGAWVADVEVVVGDPVEDFAVRRLD
ncbi:MAG: GNAT family N-acetyltransferase [Microthrixaceae bacterium]